MLQVVFGVLVSLASAIWWLIEIRDFFGPNRGTAAMHCLFVIGTGDCTQLWFVGLHQSNQIASLIFYGGLVLAGYGMFFGRGGAFNDNDTPRHVGRRRDPEVFHDTTAGDDRSAARWSDGRNARNDQ